jgi:predicted nucleic acid-binding protein
MVVVADTSPLNYLVLIGEIAVLPHLYGRVVVPKAVIGEMSHPGAPAPVAAFAANPPGWLEVAGVDVTDQREANFMAAALDPGEIAAIMLAAAHPGALLLMDETASRAKAARHGIRNTGTLGIFARCRSGRSRRSPIRISKTAGHIFPAAARCHSGPLQSGRRAKRAFVKLRPKAPQYTQKAQTCRVKVCCQKRNRADKPGAGCRPASSSSRAATNPEQFRS